MTDNLHAHFTFVVLHHQLCNYYQEVSHPWQVPLPFISVTIIMTIWYINVLQWRHLGQCSGSLIYPTDMQDPSRVNVRPFDISEKGFGLTTERVTFTIIPYHLLEVKTCNIKRKQQKDTLGFHGYLASSVYTHIYAVFSIPGYSSTGSFLVTDMNAPHSFCCRPTILTRREG